MVAFILALGALMAAIGLFGAVAPRRMAGMVAGVTFTEGLRYLAAYVRFAVGILLFFAAYQTRFSLAVQVLAVLTALSGVATLGASLATSQRWIDAVSAWPAGAFRGIAAVAFALGVFLIGAAL